MGYLPLALCGLTLAIGVSPAFAADAVPVGAEASNVTPFVNTDGEIRVLPRTRPDRLYQLHIGLPASYGKEPTRKYPVIYVTDGYWHYAVVRSIYWGLTFDNTLPESIVVGIGYAGENLDYGKLRGTDLCPPLRMNMPFDPAPTVGQADQFLSVIEKQAIPLIEREYRVDSQHRVLVGGSLGGLFTLYALFTRPDLFQGYVAASPSVVFVWPYEEEFARSKQTINAPVFMSVGGMESAAYQNDVVLLHERLASRDYLKGGYEFARFEAMRHDGAIYQAFAEGLQSVAKSIAPEHGIEGSIAPQLAANYYVIHFNRTAALPPEPQWTRAQRTAIQRHRRLLDEMMKEKKIVLTARTPDGNALMFSTIGLNAHDKAQAERMAAADPAVVAGLLSFEVMNLTEQRRGP